MLMQIFFGCNMLVLNGGCLEQLILWVFLIFFIDFCEEVVVCCIVYELCKVCECSYIFCGLVVVVFNVDEIVVMICVLVDVVEVCEKLMIWKWLVVDIVGYIQLIDDLIYMMNDDGIYNLFEIQVCVILELCFQCLIQIGVKEVIDEFEELVGKIKEYFEIFSLCECIMGLIFIEFMEVKEKFFVDCCIEIVDWFGDMDDEDLIECEDMVVMVMFGGYIKCIVLIDFCVQKCGGKGILGMQIKEEDVVMIFFVVNIYMQFLFFMIDGMVYKFKIWCLLLGGCIVKGKVIVNILLILIGVLIVVIMLVDCDEKEWDDLQVVFVID